MLYETLFPTGWEDSTPKLRRLFEIKHQALRLQDATFEEIEDFVLKIHNSGTVQLGMTLVNIQAFRDYSNPNIKGSSLVWMSLKDEIEEYINKEALPVLENYRTSWCRHHSIQFQMQDVDISKKVQNVLDTMTKDLYVKKYEKIYSVRN